MGRFETAAEFYRFREPYPPAFFAQLADRLALTNRSRLLDVACGPGNLAIGFAPYVGAVTAVDREPAMLREAARAASEAGVSIQFVESNIEDLPVPDASFDLITIGRAIHWLPREASLNKFESVLAHSGAIAVCAPSPVRGPEYPWIERFHLLRQKWASEKDEERYRPDLDKWFEGSRFHRTGEVAVTQRHRVTIHEVIGRALSFSVTAPAVLGDRRAEFEQEIRTELEPFVQEGLLEEEINAKAILFG